MTVVAPKWSRASYSGHSGVGAVPKAISTVKATATNQKPVVCEAGTSSARRPSSALRALLDLVDLHVLAL
ncbi:hypothetical protein [Streptomyces puniciscabiei]|uniref:hypothetical protein n=1 Tax=Streptomyces puniciscabiei TaxID=164348 RepID=UPI0037A9D874